MQRLGRGAVLAALLVLGTSTLSGCESGVADYPDPTRDKYEETGGSLLGGEGGIGGAPTPEIGAGGSGIGVNSFLWRASLDTLSFMPLVSADPFGGVIITDWYSPPEIQAERFKITVYILGRVLRADGVRASVFRQNRDATGGWVDAKVEQKTATDLEDTILTRARQLRIAGLQ